MSSPRTIESPGIQISEVDLSLRASTAATTNNLIIGYSQFGPTEEVVSISTMSEFEDIFGTPTNAAERYFYYNVQGAFEGPGNVQVARIPYGADTGDDKGTNYSALVYPVLPIPATLSAESATSVAISGTSLVNAQAFYIGQPTYQRLTLTQYEDIKSGVINWSSVAGLSSVDYSQYANIGSAGLVVINKARLAVNNNFEGYYIGIADNINFNPATDFDAVGSLYSISDVTGATFTNVSTNRLSFSLSSDDVNSSTYKRGTTSELIEQIPSFDINGSSFVDTLTIGVFKLRPSIYAKSETSLDQVYVEGFFGSLNPLRKLQDPKGGSPASFYLKDRINDASPNIEILLNPFISEKSSWADPTTGDNNIPAKKAMVYRSVLDVSGSASLSAHTTYVQKAVTSGWLKAATNLYTFATFENKVPNLANKHIGNLPVKLDRILRQADNADLIPLDIVADAGLSTIWANYKGAVEVSPTLSASGQFDDSLNLDITELYSQTGDPISGTISDSWEVIYGIFEKFAQYERKDHLFISDPLRNIFIQGSDKKVLSRKDRNFSQHIYWALRNLYQGSNSNYVTQYSNWMKLYDGFSDSFFWCPMSGKIMGMMNRNDANVAPWSAPAGLNRGVLSGVLDIAINPNTKQRDLLYRNGLNPVVLFPNDGYVVWGQKTRQVKPSAFDRINVRRLFLYAEKATLRVMKYFVFEPNTVFTRSRVVNTLTPIFEFLKNNEGVYDYRVIADERVNTPEVIDNNELRVSVYLKPTRTCEFVICEFYATKTSTNFDELI